MNSFGTLFRISIYGESHSKEMGILIDGVKPGIKLEISDFLDDLERRKPKKYGTARIEEDNIIIKSGIFNDYTTGAPLAISIFNNNIIEKDYSNLSYHFRPSHADKTYHDKYHSFNDFRGGGASSGRLTALIVCAGVVAKKMLNLSIESEIINLGGETNKDKFEEILDYTLKNNDSVGGVIRIKVNNISKSLGEPYFDSLESVISHLLFSIPAVKGVSFGSAFVDDIYFGSKYNDLIIDNSGKTKTNHDGGVNGGITNGNPLVINIFIKPTSSIKKGQITYNFKTNTLEELIINGRHDYAIILRCPVILEAAISICLCDLYLRNKVYEI